MTRLVFQPAVHDHLKRGIRQIVAPIRLTLGPLPRMVAMDSSFDGEPPEMLDKGSVIARRVIQLSDPNADMGANLVRGLLWRLHKQTGDATATAAVLFQSIYEQGVKLLAAGADPMALRRGLELGEKIILTELARHTTALADSVLLSRAAKSFCQGDPALGNLLGEIFTVLDEVGAVDVRSGYERSSRWEYVDGTYWAGGVLAAELLQERRIELENPAVLVTDLALDDVRHTACAVEAAVRAGKRSLVIFATHIKPNVTAFLVANRNTGRFPIIAVKTPGSTKQHPDILADLTILLGGRALLKAAGSQLSVVHPDDLGSARSVWADRDYVGMSSGAGDPARRRLHIDRLKARLSSTDDPDQQTYVLERLGKLMGGAAILWIGGVTQREIKERKALAENAITTLRGAVRGGILPGAGISLLMCKQALERQIAVCDNFEERAGLAILSASLEQPARAILENAGCDASAVLAALSLHPPCTGYDVVNNRFVPLLEAGIIDSASAYRAAIWGSIHAAASALTIDVLIHTRKPDLVLEPG